MKCKCSECGGTGECQDCDGDGAITTTIQKAELSPAMDNYEELFNLKQDCHRVTEQTERLCKLKPEHADKYRAQLAHTLKEINHKASQLVED